MGMYSALMRTQVINLRLVTRYDVAGSEAEIICIIDYIRDDQCVLFEQKYIVYVLY